MNSVSNLSLMNTLLDSAAKNKNNYSELMVKISAGQKYLAASEAPAECNQITAMTNNLAKTEQWSNNAETAVSFETATSSALSSITDTMNSVNELVVEMNSGTLTTDDYTNIATQLNELIESLVISGNTSYGSVELFAGVSTGSDPFTVTRNTDGDIESVSFLDDGTTSKRQVSISSGDSVEYGITGDEIFSFENYEYDESTSSWGYVSVNIFDTLIEMRDTLNSGELPSDTLCERAQAGLDNVTTQYVESSASQAKFESILSSLSSSVDSMTTRVSDMSTLDTAAATVELAAYETALEASYEVLAGVNSLSLLDYI